MPRDVIDLPLQERAAVVRSVDEDSRTVEVVWTTGAQVRRFNWAREEEFDEELVVDPSAMRLGRLNGGAPFLASHVSWALRSVLGSVVHGSVRVEGGKGYARVRLTEAPDAAPEIQRLREGHLAVSVGYAVHRFERVAKADRKDGGTRALYRAVDWEPMEISAVAIGADPGAGFREAELRSFSCTVTRRGASQAEEGDMPDDVKAAAGVNPEAARGEGQAPAPTDTTPAPAAPEARAAGPDVAQAARAAVEAERQRVASIRGLCRRHQMGDEFVDGLIERGASLDEARNAVLDALADRDPLQGRVHEPAPAQARGTGERDIAFRDAVGVAIMHRYNPGAHQLPDDAREFRGMTLVELARTSLERMGVSTRGMSRMEIAAAAFNTRAGIGYHSSSDFPAILANVANKTLRAAYEVTPRTFASWARRTTITDFKPVSRVQLGGAPDLSKVLESGEFQYGTMGEGQEVYALAKYGKIVAVTREMLINDDLSAFTRVPQAFGAAAADLESDIVYSILVDNPNMADGVALFHGTHGNLGTAAVVSEASLAEAYRKMGQQKGLEGRLIRVLPRFIIVPPGVRSVESRKQVANTTPANTQDVNVHAGRLEVIEEPRLIPGGGQDPWFLAADPSRIDTIEYAYLEGEEGVSIETRMGFEVDGMEIKARAHFAAKAIDWRGLYKNAGAAPD